MAPKVLVIGAGPSGLAAIKELREVNLDVVAVDTRDQIGGVFALDSNVTFEGLHLTTSNMFMAYSDFPPKDTSMKYWSKAEYYDYLCDYADHFELHSHIKFETSVENAKLDKTTGKWEVTMMSMKDKVSQEEVFDYLIVATGANYKPSIPSGVFDGFTGEIIHSSEYHTAEQVRGKKVMVVGTGESATDVAWSAGKVADTCTVWGRRYPDMAPRFISDIVEDPNFDELKRLKNQDNLLPKDTLEIVTTSRMVRNLPLFAWSASLFALLNDVKAKYGAKSAHHVICDIDTSAWGDDKVMSDTAIIPTKTMIMGVSAAKGELDFAIAKKISCKEKTITFHNPSYYKNNFTSAPTVDVDVDVIIACTGYHTRQLDKWLETPESYETDPRLWFKHCFPPKMGNNLAFLGYARPHSGGIPQCSEILSRYIAQILTGTNALPQNYAEIAKADGECDLECYHLTPHNHLVVDYHAFMVSVGRLIGCSPYMPYNPIQIVKHWTFPLWPCFFRMRGPGANKEAFDAVLNKFGPFDALAPTPFLIVELLFTFVMPFVNTFSYLFGWIFDIGKKGTLPRGFTWRMSKFHFMYNNLKHAGFEDLKFLGGQFIAGTIVFQYLIFRTITSILPFGKSTAPKAKSM